LEAARIWLSQAQQHLSAYPKQPADPAACTFDPQTLPMMNQLIENKVIRYAAALKRSEESGANPGSGSASPSPAPGAAAK
jgi:hypothetical protein